MLAEGFRVLTRDVCDIAPSIICILNEGGSVHVGDDYSVTLQVRHIVERAGAVLDCRRSAGVVDDIHIQIIDPKLRKLVAIVYVGICRHAVGSTGS